MDNTDIKLKDAFKNDRQAQGLLKLTIMARKGNSHGEVLARQLLLNLSNYDVNIDLAQIIGTFDYGNIQALFDVIAFRMKCDRHLPDYLEQGWKIFNWMWDEENT